MTRRVMLTLALLCGLLWLPSRASAQIAAFTDLAMQEPNGAYDTVMIYGWAAANGHTAYATALLDGQPQFNSVVAHFERDDVRDWVVEDAGWLAPVTDDCGFSTDACFGVGTVLDVTGLSSGWHWVAYAAYAFTDDPNDLVWFTNSNMVWFYKE